MRYTRVPLVVLSLATAPAFAADADLSLTNNSVKGQIDFLNPGSDLQMGAGYTYHQGGRNLFNLDFHAQGRTAIGNLPTTAGIGMKAIGYDQDNLSGGALGLGGFGTVNIPRVPGLSVTGSLHYAPSILSFGDSDNMTALELRASYRVIRNAEVYGGYRYINTDLQGYSGNINLDEGLMAGMKIYF